jgi:hypothetical protein
VKFLFLFLILIIGCVWLSRENKSKLQIYTIAPEEQKSKVVARKEEVPAPQTSVKASEQLEVVTPAQNEVTAEVPNNEYLNSPDDEVRGSMHTTYSTYNNDSDSEVAEMDVGPSEIFDPEAVSREPAQEKTNAN